MKTHDNQNVIQMNYFNSQKENASRIKPNLYLICRNQNAFALDYLMRFRLYDGIDENLKLF